MNRRVIVPIVVLALAAAGGTWWWLNRDGQATDDVVLHGNVELREVSVAFTDSGRIERVFVEEGTQVHPGDLIARLDTSRLMPALAQAEAQVAGQAAVVAKLKAGSRPEEIAQAKATAAAARADATNAALANERVTMLASSANASSTVTTSQIDAAKAAADAAAAKAAAADQAVAIVVAGPRKEDVAQAEAQLKGLEAGRDLIKQQLADASLKAPVAGIVRSRLLEPGEIASAQRPVVSIAVVDPKWVRAYLSEPDLVRVKQGQAAAVSVDGLAKPLAGTVGFISPVAEFTPRAIQTQELRTSLVYEVRIIVQDPNNTLLLGMPATVRLSPAAATLPVAPPSSVPPTPATAPTPTAKL